MMKSRCLLPLVMLTLAVAMKAGAETVLSRSGELLAAEFTSAAPAGASLDPFRYPDLPKKRIFAAVMLRPAPGRGVSIYDYALYAYNREMPCIGMSLGENRIDPKLKEVPAARFAKEKKICFLFFVLDGTLFGTRNVEALHLRCRVAPETIRDQRIYLTNRKGRAFSTASEIPAAGKMATKEQ